MFLKGSRCSRRHISLQLLELALLGLFGPGWKSSVAARSNVQAGRTEVETKRERQATLTAGEDIHTSHAGVGTHFMPYIVEAGNAGGAKDPRVSDRPSAKRDRLLFDARIRRMDEMMADRAHVGPSALIVLRTEDDVKSMYPLVNAFLELASQEEESEGKQTTSPQWKCLLFSPTIRCERIAELLDASKSAMCSPTSAIVYAPTGEVLDKRAAKLDAGTIDPTAYEIAVETHLPRLLHRLKARMVVLIGDPIGAVSRVEIPASDGDRMASAALGRAVWHATATYNEGTPSDVDETATLIAVEARDPLYLGFLPALDAATVAAWHMPKISIHVITNDRLPSLMRLMSSLQGSHFLGDGVQLVFHVDVGADNELMDYIMNTKWTHGDMSVYHRIKRGGLMSAVAESFYPSDPHDYAIILEDDIEVSSGFYAWAKHLLLRYRYSSNTAYPASLTTNTTLATPLAGISLYTPRIEEVTGRHKRLNFDQVAGGYGALLFQTPCSWGALYFPEVWMQLHATLVDTPYNKIPKANVNNWSSSWKKYMFSLFYHNDWYLIYPGYEQQQSFATNHVEKGMHFGQRKRVIDEETYERYRVPLFEDGNVTFWVRKSLLLPSLGDLAKVSVRGEVVRAASAQPTETGGDGG